MKAKSSFTDQVSGTFVIKQTFYLQEVEPPKVTLGILLWILNEHSVQVWGPGEGEIRCIFDLLVFLENTCFVCNSMGYLPAEGHWGHHNLYLKALKGLLLEHTAFYKNVTLLSRNMNNSNTFVGLVGKVRKKLSPEGGRKGGRRKKACSARAPGLGSNPGPAAC